MKIPDNVIFEDLFDLMKSLIGGIFGAIFMTIILGQKIINSNSVYLISLFFILFSLAGIGIILFRYFNFQK